MFRLLVLSVAAAIPAVPLRAVSVSLRAVSLRAGLLAAAPQAPAQEAPAPTGAALPAMQVGPHVFHRRQLGNGLRAVAVRDGGPKVSVFMVVSAGKRQETPATTGLAHLTEHAMYAGTERTPLGRHDRIVHAMGGESNAFTRDDYTLFYDDRIPVAQLSRVLAMEADRLRGLAFDPPSVLFERERLRREEARTWTPKDARRELLEAAVYQKHNYRAGILDPKGHTKAPTADVASVRAFYDAYYQPDRTAVVVVGDLPPETALDAIAAAFGSLPRGAETPPLATEPDPEGPRTVVIEADLPRDRCHLVWLVPALGHPDRTALAVLARLLGRQTLESGTPVEATMGMRVDREIFDVSASGADTRAGLEALVARARNSTFDPAAVAQTARLVADEFATLPLRGRPYFSLGGTFGVFEVLGHIEFLVAYAARARAVTPQALREVARRHLDPARQTTVRYRSSGRAYQPLPSDPKLLQRAAEEADAAGDFDRAITAYTRLLAAGPNRMFQVIFLASRGQIYVKKKDYAGAIRDYEDALRVVDYPAVHKLLREARELQAAAGGDGQPEKEPGAPAKKERQTGAGR